MAYVADLHIHSRFSRACSRDLNIPNLSKWAKYKGIDLLSTGDCFHPLWQTEVKKDLKEIGDGTYEPRSDRGEYDGVKFIFGSEVACIYSDMGLVKRIHILILLPSLDSVEKISETLTKKGVNLSSDGRPIMGMSSQQLCEIIFNIEPNAILIPAHIWTPWFSLYGSNSGYNNLKDCFKDYSDQIYAVETGLSSEPAMNWRISDLDNKSIVSFSDLHSLPRLGREVTIFGGELSYEGLLNSLKNQNILGTIEFFPEEGKYHYSGHRNCNVVLGPEELKKNGEICPVCTRKLTIGVIQRVEDLATRTINDLGLTIKDRITKSGQFPKRAGFRMLVQLEEIIAQALNTTVASQRVKNEYEKLVTRLDPELKILTRSSLDDISKISGERLAEGIDRVRKGLLKIESGYDNTYGVVKIWDKEEEQNEEQQISLF